MPAETPELLTVKAPFPSTERGPPEGIETPPTALAVARGKSAAAKEAVEVICPKPLKLTFVAVPAVTVAAILKAPAPETERPPH